MRRRNAFTLVELLVVIGIIAILISVLLPTLSKARASAQTVACASNSRQLALAIRLFAQEHRGYMPCVSDKDWAWQRDPTRSIWVYRSGQNPPVVLDWASSLLPYLGNRTVEWFNDAPDKVAKIYVCPSDDSQNIAGSYGTSSATDPQGPGLLIFNNMTNSRAGYPISYGINADIGCLIGNDGLGHFAPGSDQNGPMNVYGGPTAGPGKPGQPMGAKFDRIRNGSEVLLIADCGTRPRKTGDTPGLLRNDVLAYTSWDFSPGAAVTKNDLGRLSATSKSLLLKNKIPWARHRDKINVAFADGHGETILKGDEQKVKISPWKF